MLREWLLVGGFTPVCVCGGGGAPWPLDATCYVPATSISSCKCIFEIMKIPSFITELI